MKCKWIAALLVSGSLMADTLIEAKGAYYYPTSSDFREIYSSSGMYGIEGSHQFWRRLYWWASASVFVKEGYSIGLRDRTRIAFYPFGLGLKYLFPYRKVDFYLGGGGLLGYMHIHDHSAGIPKKTCRWGGGGIAKAGMIVNCTEHFFLDAFTDYSFLYVPAGHRSGLTTHTADLSGWSVGLGIGFRFGPDINCCNCCPTDN